MQPKTVLLIDDDADILHMYTLKFSLDNDLRLVTADKPEDGLSIAERLHPDLILLDLILPKRFGIPYTLNKEVGLHVLEQLKLSKGAKDIPVVVLTNLDEQNGDSMKKAKSLGALDYWVKANHSPSEVVAKVKGLLLSK